MPILVFLFGLGVFFIGGANAYAQTPGQWDYDQTERVYKFYDGSNWYEVGTGLGLIGCSKEAALDFVSATGSYRYCNGTVWIPIVGTVTLSGCSKKGARDYFNNSYHYCNGLLWVNMKGPLSGGLLSLID